MKRPEWEKAVDPFIHKVAADLGGHYTWEKGVLTIARPGAKLGKGVELNVKRIFLRAGKGLLGEDSVHRNLRDGFASDFDDLHAPAFPAIEATYFQESGYFAIIPDLTLPTTPTELRSLIGAALDANDWLASQLSGLKPGTTGVPALPRRPRRTLQDSDFHAVVAILRLSQGLHPAAARRMQERVCGIADLVSPTGISGQASTTLESRIREHVVPCAALVRLLLQRIGNGADDQESAALLKKHLAVVTITEVEARRLNSVLKSKDTMPDPAWTLEDGDTYARLHSAKIPWSPLP